jgi:starch phosphorylase
MSYFSGYSMEEVKSIEGSDDDRFQPFSLCSENGKNCQRSFPASRGSFQSDVEQISGICEITSITNAQEFKYWADKPLYNAKDENDETVFDYRKKHLKKNYSKS